MILDRSYLFECGDPFLKASSTAVFNLVEKLQLANKTIQWQAPTDRLLGCGYSFYHPPRLFVPSAAPSVFFCYVVTRRPFTHTPVQVDLSPDIWDDDSDGSGDNNSSANTSENNGKAPLRADVDVWG
jgi:hypothetical protein